MSATAHIRAPAPALLDQRKSSSGWRPFRLPVYGWYLLPLLVGTTLVVAVPLGYSFYLSFQRFNLSQPYLGLTYVRLDNYIAAFRDASVLASIKVTLEYLSGSLLGEILIGFALALLLNQRLPGLRVFRVLLIMPLMLTPAAVGMVWKLFYSSGGIVNYLLETIGLSPVNWFSSNTALLSVIIVSVWQNFPFAFLVFSAGMQTIPPTLIEAAQIDGASRWRIFCQITLPLMQIFIITVLIIRTTNILRYVDLIFTLTSGGPGRATESFAFLIYTNAFSLFEMGYGSALSFLLIALSFGIGLVYMKFIR